jgi:hypothetical protein
MVKNSNLKKVLKMFLLFSTSTFPIFFQAFLLRYIVHGGDDTSSDFQRKVWRKSSSINDLVFRKSHGINDGIDMVTSNATVLADIVDLGGILTTGKNETRKRNGQRFGIREKSNDIQQRTAETNLKIATDIL